MEHTSSPRVRSFTLQLACWNFLWEALGLYVGSSLAHICMMSYSSAIYTFTRICGVVPYLVALNRSDSFKGFQN